MSDDPSPIKRYIDDFFTNWDQDMPLAEKIGKTLRNRYRATVLMKGCCGNHGEPGC